MQEVPDVKWNSPPDRLTQLQLHLRELTVRFYTSIGAIQRDSEPLPEGQKVKVAQVSTTGEAFNIVDLAREVVETSQFIDTLIDSLPGGNSTSQEQFQKLQQLQEENKMAGEFLQKNVLQAKNLLSNLQLILQSLQVE